MNLSQEGAEPGSYSLPDCSSYPDRDMFLFHGVVLMPFTVLDFCHRNCKKNKSQV